MHTSGTSTGQDAVASTRQQGAGPERKADKPDLGLTRGQRMMQSALFRQAFDGGKKEVGRFMVMWLREGADASRKLGVVASRRTFRRSVDRSRAKRLLREAYRLNRFRLRGNVDVVLVAKRDILKANSRDVGDDLLGVAKRAGVLDKETQ